MFTGFRLLNVMLFEFKNPILLTKLVVIRGDKTIHSPDKSKSKQKLGNTQ